SAPLSRVDGDGAKGRGGCEGVRSASGTARTACPPLVGAASAAIGTRGASRLAGAFAAEAAPTEHPGAENRKARLSPRFDGARGLRVSAHVELAGVDHAAVLRHLDAVAAGRPAVGVADVEVGGLRARGNVLGFFRDRLVALQMGPFGDEAAGGGAVGGDRGMDGVAG